MEVPGSRSSDYGSDIELDDKTNELLELDPAGYNPYLPLDKFEFGSVSYCDNFKKALTIEPKLRTKHEPFPWQLEVALGCHLGRDGFLLAGTGSGKTLAMIILSFLDRRHRVFIISPLNALANAQVKQFEDWGLTAVAVIISSIEAFLDPTRLLPIVKSPELAALGP
ncbi:DEAD/DEAH-box helicase [Rhizoctonia solani AG-3 Rhs1AP]|uniref:DEAD/DEAH-box helicase n=2 Tax=Rhizoctonia solani AG-3 TaxID=1086053 RepID=A0A074RD72_9AGAM|nr:DEAD/DEAH-box helicase [Rhizoctonia solani AG-3 Rhs1AP]KEP45131.1 DEAD/DEAH-box helicase [Rhizoctonia solani 123E]